MDKILVFVEIKGDEVKKASLELLSEGRRLAQAGRYTVEAVTLGRLPLALEEKLMRYADTLVHIVGPSPRHVYARRVCAAPCRTCP